MIIIENHDCCTNTEKCESKDLLLMLLPIFLAITVLLSLIIVAWLAHKFYRKRKKKQLGSARNEVYSYTVASI